MKLLESILQDVSYALRTMRQTPMLTAAAILSLGLGIGANTAIFSLIDTIMLSALPVRSPQELMQLAWTSKERPVRFIDVTSGRGVEMNGRNVRLPFSYDTYKQLRDRSTTFSGVMGRFRIYEPAIVIAQGRADTARVELVSGNFFDVLGIGPIAGRLLNDNDDRENAAPVAVVSHEYWKNRFGSDPDIAGRSILINGVSFTIAGVAAEGFQGIEVGSGNDLYLPLDVQPLVATRRRGNTDMLHTKDWWWVEIVGRRKPGVTEARVRSEMDTLFRQSLVLRGTEPVKPEDYPSLVLGSAARGQSGLRYRFSQPLTVLMTIVGFVLLIGCANVANLLMARAVARQKEMAMRHALGATRGRLFRQMIVESIMLSLAGGAVGLAIEHWGTIALLRIFSSETDPLVLDVQTNAVVLAFLIGISLLVGLIFGLAPAIQSARLDLNTMLKRTMSGAGGRFSTGRVLLTMQVAMSLTLLIGAGLYIRTLWNLRHVTLGFNPQNVLVFRIAPKRGGYEAGRMQQLLDRVVGKLRETSGVRSVSYSQLGMLARLNTSGPVRIPGSPVVKTTDVRFLDVGPDFFASMQMALTAGRALDERDGKNAPPVAVVNEHFAKIYFNASVPLGAQFTDFLDQYKKPIEIVGVIKDAKYDSVIGERDVVYLPYAQRIDAETETVFVVRSYGDPRVLTSAVRGVMQSIDSNLAVFGVTTQSAMLDANIRDQRLMAGLAAGFALLALLLAAIGLYGVISYSVTRQTAEIGIRMALGAGRRRVLGQVLRDSLWPVAIGMMAGLGIAWGATKFIQAQLYGLEPRDPSTTIGAAALIAVVAIVASLLPAWRASQVDPMTALRHE